MFLGRYSCWFRSKWFCLPGRFWLLGQYQIVQGDATWRAVLRNNLCNPIPMLWRALLSRQDTSSNACYWYPTLVADLDEKRPLRYASVWKSVSFIQQKVKLGGWWKGMFSFSLTLDRQTVQQMCACFCKRNFILKQLQYLSYERGSTVHIY